MADTWNRMGQRPLNTGNETDEVRRPLPSNLTSSSGTTIAISQNSWQRVWHSSKVPEFQKHNFRDCFSILGGSLLATGVLIAPNAILTVNHFRKASLFKNNSWLVTNGIHISDKAKFVCKPTSSPLKILNEDLEVLITQQNIKDIQDISPVKFASTKEINQATEGLTVGYGADENGVSGVKRELKVDVELCSINFNTLLFNCSSKRHLIIKAPGKLNALSGRIETDGINPRDSGSPLYINCNGIIKLAGIASMSLDGGKAGLFIRVDTYEKEIKKILAKFPPEN